MAEILLTPLEQLPPIESERDEAVLRGIAPEIVGELINRHINPTRFREDPKWAAEMPDVTTYMGDSSNMWTPALFVPWSLGRNYSSDQIWTPADSPLPEVARTALEVNLLTEDNLPWYTWTIQNGVRGSDALEFWNRIWTGEEDRHAEVLRSYMHLGRVVDPVALERARMQQLITAEVPDPPSTVELSVYVTLQELATRISHLNTGKLLSDTAKRDSELFPLIEDGTALANLDDEIVRRLEPEELKIYFRQVGRAAMTRIAGDENKHHVFYRELVERGALPIDPSLVVRAIEMQVRAFQMPGVGIDGFRKKALAIAYAGIYDLRIHLDQIVKPVLKRWKFEELTGLDEEAERSRERTLLYLQQQEVVADRFTEKRQQRRAKALETGDTEDIWVGKQAA